jgi:hypothetical protein
MPHHAAYVQYILCTSCSLFSVLNYFSLYVCFDYLPPQWGLFDRTFGRADAQDADPEGRVPEWSKASVQEMKDRFVAVGLGPRQVTTTSLLDS